MIIILSSVSYFQKDIQLYSAIMGGENENSSTHCKIYNGMCANYTFDFSGDVSTSHFIYTQVSDNLFKVKWIHVGGTSSWNENKRSRSTSNSSGIYGVRNRSKAFLWLFTNISLGDLILIAVDGIGNHLFNVTDELCCNYTGIGEVEVWVLQDMSYGGVAWYEKSTGTLLNGTFVWYSANSYEFSLISTNIFSYYQEQKRNGEMLEYALFIFIPLGVSIIALVTLRRRGISLNK
jgi:hypothetical protein